MEKLCIQKVKKSQKGITLASLIVYIITMLIMIAIISVITTYFYTNLTDINKTIEPLTEEMTFNTYFSDEINHNSIKVSECTTNYIVFSNGVQYTFVGENKGIYRNNVKICRGVKSCTFTNTIPNGKNIVTVEADFGKGVKTISYTID